MLRGKRSRKAERRPRTGHDTRAAQAKTVLEMAVECIQKAHTCIDEQESQDQNLILAYFDRKGDAPRLAR